MMQEGQGEDALHLTDVPLHDLAPVPTIDPAIEAASRVNVSEWEERYKTIIGTGIERIKRLASLDSLWRLSESDHRVALYEMDTAVKVTAIVHGRAERYLYVAKDHDKDSRMKWDTQDGLVSVNEYHRFRPPEGDIVLVDSRFSLNSYIYSDRYVLGIMNSGFDATLNLYKLVFCTAPHYYYTCPKDCVAVQDVTVGVLVRQLEDEKCELTIIAAGSFGIPFMYRSYYAMRLRERVLLYEKVVLTWNAFYPLDPKKVENRK